MGLRLRFTIVLLMLLSAASQASAEDADIGHYVQRYIAAQEARQQPDSAVADVDALLALLADDFIDEHANAGVTIRDRDELRNGLLEKLKDEVFYLRMVVEDMVVVGHRAAVKVVTEARVKPAWSDKTFEHTSAQLMTLEFTSEGLLKYRRIY